MRVTEGREYYEIDRARPGSSSLLPMKNHQGGMNDHKDESDSKCFAFPDSTRCPVKTIKNYLSHLSPDSMYVPFSAPKVTQPEVQPFEGRNLVLQCSCWRDHTWILPEDDEYESWHCAPLDESLCPCHTDYSLVWK